MSWNVSYDVIDASKKLVQRFLQRRDRLEESAFRVKLWECSDRPRPARLNMYLSQRSRMNHQDSQREARQWSGLMKQQLKHAKEWQNSHSGKTGCKYSSFLSLLTLMIWHTPLTYSLSSAMVFMRHTIGFTFYSPVSSHLAECDHLL